MKKAPKKNQEALKEMAKQAAQKSSKATAEQPKQVPLTVLSVEQLKVAVYDLSKVAQDAQQRIQIIEQELARRAQQQRGAQGAMPSGTKG